MHRHADSYGPFVSEELIAEVLHPYGDVKIAAKAGPLRTGPNVWVPCGRPEYLRQECELSLRRLDQESLDHSGDVPTPSGVGLEPARHNGIVR